MSVYDGLFADDPAFERRRSVPRTVLAVLAAVAVAVALVVLVTDFADFQRDAVEQADQSVLARSRVMTRFGPAAGVLLGVVGVPVLLWAAVTRCHVWVRRETGARLRRRAELGFAGGGPAMAELHARFATGDPGVYTPVPDAKADGRVAVWVVPEDSVGYVGLNVGSSARTAVNAPLLTFTGVRYEGLLAALEEQLHRPLPDDRNPVRQATGA